VSPRAGIVCLDLQRNRQAAEGVSPTLAMCRRVLSEARRRRWPVLHVHARQANPLEGRPIVGLEPRPNEAVFVRQGPSAFSSPGFARAAAALGGPLALIGFSLHDTVLATAFAAADRNLDVDVLRNAVWGGADAVDDILLAPLRALAPQARIVEVADLFRDEQEAFTAANLP
jgi:nicotinamidase-related amidase